MDGGEPPRWNIDTSNSKSQTWFFLFIILNFGYSFTQITDVQHWKLNHPSICLFFLVYFCLTSCSTSNSALLNWSASIRSSWCWRRSSSLSRRSAPTWRAVTIRLLPSSLQTLKNVFENYSKSTTKWPPDSAFLLQSTLKQWLVVVICFFFFNFRSRPALDWYVLDPYFWVSCYCCCVTVGFDSVFSLTFVALDVLMHLLQQHLFVVAWWRPVIWIKPHPVWEDHRRSRIVIMNFSYAFVRVTEPIIGLFIFWLSLILIFEYLLHKKKHDETNLKHNPAHNNKLLFSGN